jgi:hypothetical protein
MSALLLLADIASPSRNHSSSETSVWVYVGVAVAVVAIGLGILWLLRSRRSSPGTAVGENRSATGEQAEDTRD